MGIICKNWKGKKFPQLKRSILPLMLFLLRSVGILELLSLDSVCKILLEALLAVQEQKPWFVKVYLDKFFASLMAGSWYLSPCCVLCWWFSSYSASWGQEMRIWGFFKTTIRFWDISSLWVCPDVLSTHLQSLQTAGCRYKFSVVFLFGQTEHFRGKTQALSFVSKGVPQGIPGVTGKN